MKKQTYLQFLYILSKWQWPGLWSVSKKMTPVLPSKCFSWIFIKNTEFCVVSIHFWQFIFPLFLSFFIHIFSFYFRFFNLQVYLGLLGCLVFGLYLWNLIFKGKVMQIISQQIYHRCNTNNRHWGFRIQNSSGFDVIKP